MCLKLYFEIAIAKDIFKFKISSKISNILKYKNIFLGMSVLEDIYESGQIST